MSTYYRKGNSFYKVDENLIKEIEFKDSSACVSVVESLPEGSGEVHEEVYVEAVASVVKFGCIGGHPDIPPSE